MRRVYKRYGDFICRRCINRQFNANLRPEDCRYGYTFKCPSCKQPSQIVMGLSFSGKLKTLFK